MSVIRTSAIAHSGDAYSSTAMTPLYVVLQGASPDAQLSRAEIETLFEFAFRVHNHDA
jgi:hypothetical protein